jgi:hypothetical protein
VCGLTFFDSWLRIHWLIILLFLFLFFGTTFLLSAFIFTSSFLSALFTTLFRFLFSDSVTTFVFVLGWGFGVSFLEAYTGHEIGEEVCDPHLELQIALLDRGEECGRLW